jgi:dTDP-4-amino-4,6-dideoxygalactose transaminase
LEQKNYIPVMKPRLPTAGDYSHYLELMDERGVYSNGGPLVKLLEARYAEKLGISNSELVVLCSNATTAIHGFLQISQVDNWHIPSFTFAATVQAGVQSGKRVILNDIDKDTWMISPAAIQESQSEGLVSVLPFGAPFNWRAHLEIEHLLIDAAASIGGARDWIIKLQENWAAVFSLHATKSFGIGEGGLIIFGSERLANEFRRWINFGFSGSRESVYVGTNAKLSEIQAAVGLAVLDNWSLENNEWEAGRGLTDIVTSGLGLAYSDVIPRGTISPYWIISHEDPATMSRIERACLEHQIETRKWWAEGCHLMPAFSEIPIAGGGFKSTQFVSQRYLGLPFYRGMSSKTLDCIGDVLSEILRSDVKQA